MTPARLAKVVLGILGVWGLLSGLMLVRTLLATRQIDARVKTVTTSVSEIDRDTDSTALMLETNRLSAELLAASAPLPGTLDALRDVTAGLAGKVESILAGTTTIERNSLAIEGRVLSARDTASAINGDVTAIGESLGDILAALRATRAAAGEINPAVTGINTAVAALLPVTQAIDSGIGAANRGIDEAAAIVVALAADIGNILARLPDIEGHAKSIGCSSGLGLIGPGEDCP